MMPRNKWLPPILTERTLRRADAFWILVAKGDDEQCWPWMGGRTGDGYGVYRLRTYYRTGAHRVAYALSAGEEPGAGHVCHSCDNPLCCNPNHLWLGSPKSNAEDKVQKGRARGRFSRKGSSEPTATVDAPC